MLLLNLLRFAFGLTSLAFLFTSAFYDQVILLISLFGILTGIIGFYVDSRRCIEASHYALAALIPLGAFIFKESHNIGYLIVILLITFGTRWYFGKCLFLDYSNNLMIPDVGSIAYNILFFRVYYLLWFTSIIIFKKIS